MRRLLLVMLVLNISGNISCYADTLDGGERLTLASKVLGENRTVFVSLPSSYSRSAQKYPVLYLTDGQWQFDHTRTSAAFLARNGLIPDMIVVAVANKDRTRDLYASQADFKQNGRTIAFPTSGHADRFLEFIEKELIPWTEAKYRAGPLRILAGHSAGGNFALHTMRVRPGLFQGVIAASPWLAWDDGKELKQLVPFLSSVGIKAHFVFLTWADEGPEMKANIEALRVAVRASAHDSLRWDSAAYPNETHDSVVIKSYFDALRSMFAGWSFPRDPKTNALTASLEDVKAHYAKVGERLGAAMLPPEALLNELGYQFLRAKNIEASISVFRYNTEMYPQSANVWDSLGDGLDSAGRKDEALASYQNAVAAARANGDPGLESFKEHVARLSQAAKPSQK